MKHIVLDAADAVEPLFEPAIDQPSVPGGPLEDFLALGGRFFFGACWSSAARTRRAWAWASSEETFG